MSSEKNEIAYHEGFKKDINDMMSGLLRGKEKQFYTQYNRVLSLLEDFHPEDIVLIGKHEKLKNAYPNCYSMHLKGKGYNIRFLVKYVQSKYVLLVAFNEIAGKKKSGYENYIPKMIKRFEEWEENQNGCKN